MTRVALRRLLEKLLPTDADLAAFCLDRFPEVSRHFADGMSRVAKSNLLLEIVEPAAIVIALRQQDSDRFGKYERALESTSIDVEVKDNPYRGLSAFQIEDARLFFGRELITQNLRQRLQALYVQDGANRLVAVIGPSGSGKSSVARAGLLAALQKHNVPGITSIRRLIMKPGEHPIEELTRALLAFKDQNSEIDIESQRRLRAGLLQQDERYGFDGLRLYASSLPEIATRPIILLVDQFEEIYTLCDDVQERNAFVSLLLTAVGGRAPHVSVVITLRSDFLGETHRQHPELNRLIGLQHEIVTAMTAQELRSAIAEPATQAGRALDSAVVDLLLAEATGHDGTLPLLQFALTQIWDGLSLEPPRAPTDTLRAIGGVGGALAHRAQAIFDKLTSAEQLIARRAFVRLVRLGEGTRDTRRRVPLRDLCGSAEGEAAVVDILRRFATPDARLVTLSGTEAEPVAEVTHEALFEHWQSLRNWIDESRVNRRFHERVTQAVQLWVEGGRHKGRLWRSPDLDLLRKFHSDNLSELSSAEIGFLDASCKLEMDEKRAERSHRRLRWFATTVTIVIPIVTLTAGAAINQKNHAQEAYMQASRQAEIAQKSHQEALIQAERAERSQEKAMQQEVEAKRALMIAKRAEMDAMKSRALATELQERLDRLAKQRNNNPK